MTTRRTTPETQLWPLGNILTTAVTEAGETAITLTCTTPGTVTDLRAALATLVTALQQVAHERRAVTA